MNIKIAILLSLVLLSMVPMIFAQEDQSNQLDTSRNELTQTEKSKILAQRAYAASSDEECVAIFKESGAERTDDALLAACKRSRVANERMEQEKATRLETYQAKLRDVSEEQAAKLDAVSKERLKEYLSLSEVQLKQKLEDIKVERVSAQEFYRIRALSETDIEQAKLRLEQAKDQYEQARERYQNAKEEWRQAIKDGNEQAAIDAAKRQLSKAVELALNAIEQIEADIESNDDLTEEEVALALSELEDKKTDLERISASVADAQTKAEIKALAQELKQMWEKARLRIKEHAEESRHASIGEIIKRSEQLDIKMERILASLDEATLAELEPKVEEFSTLLSSAKEKFADSQELFLQAKLEDDETLFEQAKALARDAHEELQEANDILMAVWKDVKASGYEGELEDDELEVAVDEQADAQKRLAQAEEAVLEAQKKIQEKADEGKDVTQAQISWQASQALLAQAQEAYDAENYAECQRLAREAKNKAMWSRGQILSSDDDDVDEEENEEVDDDLDEEDDQSDDNETDGSSGNDDDDQTGYNETDDSSGNEDDQSGDNETDDSSGNDDICPAVCTPLYELPNCTLNECGSGCGEDRETTFNELEDCQKEMEDVDEELNMTS